MRIGSFAIAAGALAMGLACWNTPATAQGPLYDRVEVTLPYTITIGDHTLQPGDYVIEQAPEISPNGALLIRSADGDRFETSALTIPTMLSNTTTPDDTKVVLHHFGSQYYFDKIWIQGKTYGYEFPLPDSVKARESERMQSVSVAARYEATPEQQAAAAAPAEPQPIAQARPEPEPAPVMTQPAESSQDNMANQNTMAQNNMPSQTSPEANQAPGTANREMPATSAGWLMMVLGGSGLSAAGLMLRQRR